MPVSVQCPECDGKSTVPDKFIGKTVRCPHCKKALPVHDPEEAAPRGARSKAEGITNSPVAPRGPKTAASRRADVSDETPRPRRRRDDDDDDRLDDEDDRPRRRRRAYDDDDDGPRRSRRKPKKSNAGLWIGVGVGAAVLLVAIAGGIVWMNQRPRPAGGGGPVANNQPRPHDPRRHYEKAFSFIAPAGWQVTDFPGSKFKVCVAQPAQNFAANINVVDEHFNGSLDAYVKGNQKALRTFFKEFRQVSEEKFVTEEGMEGVKMGFDNTQVQVGQTLRLRQYAYFFGNGNTKYVVTATALVSNYNQYLAAFDGCLRTFRFES